jgi:hypothetical protein
MKLKKLVEITTASNVTFDLNHWTYSSGDVSIFVAMYNRTEGVSHEPLENLRHIPVRSISEGYHLIARLSQSGIH